jgi:hypothetical protein
MERPSGFQEVEARRILRQSAREGVNVVSPTQRPPSPLGEIPGTQLRWRQSRPQGHRTVGRIKSVKNPKDPHRKTNPRPSGL